MKKYILPGILSCISVSLFAQIPEDVLKYSWQPVNGTARINAVGGAMGSLGGDISATFVNPAGIAFYKTADFVISPGFSFFNNKSNYRGTTSKDNTSFMNLGASGFVGGWKGGSNWNNSLSFAVTRTANFNNKVYYTGQNDFSSFAEQYAAEIANSGADIGSNDDISKLSLGTQMAVWNYLADTTTLPGHSTPDVISMAMWGALKEGGPFLVNQTNKIETRGGITEVAIAYATNKADKFYIGGSLGLPIVQYTKESTLVEEDATGNNDNNFSIAELKETFKTNGVGLNVKLGAIFKPVEYIRLGLAVHTPTWYSFEDTYSGSMSVNLENYRTTPGTTSITAEELYGSTPTYKYELSTPWKFMLSGSYVLREIEDVRKQKGFITADVEYVTYKSNKFRNAEDYEYNYDNINDVMKTYYKNAFNFRVGGELKFTTIMARLGFSYYGNPYADKELKANKMFISGGLGYRHAGMFIDLTYAHGLHKDVSFPYRLPDKTNTFASVKGSGGNIALTIGFKI
ncbi:MAG TPA: hypothetical protein VIZ28_15885 [Chitinophagaceae bacterium]